MATATRPAASRRRPDGLIRASRRELTALRQLARILNASPGGLIGLVIDEQSHMLPPSALDALRRVVASLARESAVSIVPRGAELTTQAAADMLGISRPRLIQLVDGGRIPCRREGTHRRLKLEDLLAYRDERIRAHARAIGVLQAVTDAYPES